MWRHIVSAAMVLLLSGGWTHGDGSIKKTVQELKAEIKQLRALEKTELKEIAARYDALIAKLKDPEHNLQIIRAELRIEEKTALKNVKTADQKKQIRTQYQDLIKNLSGDLKADKDAIKLLTQQKKVVEKQVKAAYAAKIKDLEDEIKLLQTKGTGKPKG
jgi:phage host-nuclease inhibitor protein Gam